MWELLNLLGHCLDICIDKFWIINEYSFIQKHKSSKGFYNCFFVIEILSLDQWMKFLNDFFDNWRVLNIILWQFRRKLLHCQCCSQSVIIWVRIKPYSYDFENFSLVTFNIVRYNIAEMRMDFSTKCFQFVIINLESIDKNDWYCVFNNFAVTFFQNYFR